MSINIDLKSQCSWFKNQDLRHTNVEKGAISQLTFTLSKSTTEILQKGVEYVQS